MKITKLVELENITFQIEIENTDISFPLGFLKSFIDQISREKINEKLQAILQETDSLLSENEKKLIRAIGTSNIVQSEIIEKPERLSAIKTAKGTISSNRAAILGKDGYFFLYGGSNNLNRLYQRTGRKKYLDWINIIVTRLAECDGQLIDREKPDIVICQTIERLLPQLPKQ